MPKTRLVITAVLIEGGSESQVARDCGVYQSWISRLIKRYTYEGDAAFEPRSRRPQTSPTRLPQTTIDLIIALRTELAGKGLDAGPHTTVAGNTSEVCIDLLGITLISLILSLEGFLLHRAW